MSSFRNRFLITLVLAAVAMTGPWSAAPAISAIDSISDGTELVHNPSVGPASGEPDVGQTAPNSPGDVYDEGVGELVKWVRSTMMIWTARWTGAGF